MASRGLHRELTRNQVVRDQGCPRGTAIGHQSSGRPGQLVGNRKGNLMAGLKDAVDPETFAHEHRDFAALNFLDALKKLCHGGTGSWTIKSRTSRPPAFRSTSR